MEILAVLVVIMMAYTDRRAAEPNHVVKVKTGTTEPSRKVDRLYTSAKYLEDR